MNMRTARVHRIVRRIAEGIFAIFILLLTIRLIYAAPTCPPKPGENKIGFCGPNMTYHEWGCIRCPPGLGSSATCGKVYPKVIKIECQPCKDGSTYSDENSFGQCKPCTTTRPCKDNEVQIGECESDRNTLKCKCKKGTYYKASTGCMPCSWCCGDKTNVYEDDCQDLEKKCSYKDVKSCDPSTTYAPGLNSTSTTAVITRSNTTDASNGSSTDTSRERDEGDLLVKILFPSVLIIGLAIICIVCFRRKKNDQPLLQPHGSDTDRDGPVMLDLDNFTAAYHIEHQGPNGEQTLPMANGTVPLTTTTLDKDKLCFICEKLGQKVSDLAYGVKQRLCEMLNVPIDGKDYRNLDEFCRLDVYQRKTLEQSQNPMEGIIEIMITQLVTLKSFLDELYRISRGDVVQELYNIAKEKNKQNHL